MTSETILPLPPFASRPPFKSFIHTAQPAFTRANGSNLTTVREEFKKPTSTTPVSPQLERGTLSLARFPVIMARPG